MKRFEIQDIVFQTEDGITYLAINRDNGDKVALRRFFPYGRDNEGLDEAGNERFLDLCGRLKNLHHPAMRKVVDGFIDPLDGLPCVVTEWVEGKPLPITLGGEKIEAQKLIVLTRAALEVSILLSNTIGKEAVWIDTTDRSVVVGPTDLGREFTFWICPFRCLEIYPLSKGVDSIAELVEELAGWKSKLYTEKAYMGLGGWVKAIKKAPQTSLQDALIYLPGSPAPAQFVHEPAKIDVSPRPGSAPKPAAPEIKPQAPAITLAPARPTATATQHAQATTQLGQQPVLKSASSSNSGWKVITAWSAAAALILGLLIVKLNSNKDEAALASNESTEVILPGMDIAEPEPEFASFRTTAATKELEDGIAMASNDASAETVMRSSNRINPAATEAIQPNQGPSNINSSVKTYRPDDKGKIKQVQPNTRVQLRGTLQNTRYCPNKYWLFLEFSKPYQHGQIRGATNINLSEETYNSKSFNSFIGKEIIIDGTYEDMGDWKNPLLVKFANIKQITVVSPSKHVDPSSATTPKLAENSATYTPDEGEKIRKTKVNRAVQLRGILKNVRRSSSGKVIYLEFSEPCNQGEIRGVVHPRSFTEKFDAATFTRFIDKEIILHGTYKKEASRKESATNPWLVQIESTKEIEVVE